MWKTANTSFSFLQSLVSKNLLFFQWAHWVQRAKGCMPNFSEILWKSKWSWSLTSSNLCSSFWSDIEFLLPFLGALSTIYRSIHHISKILCSFHRHAFLPISIFCSHHFLHTSPSKFPAMLSCYIQCFQFLSSVVFQSTRIMCSFTFIIWRRPLINSNCFCF